MKTVRDLTREQLNELKQSYAEQLKQDGDFSYEELVNIMAKHDRELAKREAAMQKALQ